MGNFLDNSLNLSSEFLRSFVTFQAQTKHYQESRTRPIPGFLGWFLLMRLDKFLPGKKKLLHRFPQTTCTITSNPPAHRRSPVSAQTHNRNCSFSHDSFTITILTSSTVVQSSHTSQYGYKQLIQLLSSCAVWKFVSSILLQRVFRITGPTSRRDGTSDLTDDHERRRTIITLSRDVIHSFTTEYHRRTIRVRLNIRH